MAAIQFLAFRWDVTKARNIAAHLPVRPLNVQPWFAWLGLIRIEDEFVRRTDDLVPDEQGARVRAAGGGTR